MKKIVTILLTAFLFATASKAQYVTIPDANFRTFLETKYPSCFNSAHEMDTTCSGVVNAVSINCNYKGIANLDGLQYFKSLQNFSCSNNSLSGLPNLSSTITYIECNNNQILGLPALPSGLQVLKCGFNQITSLPALPNTLITLECNINQLTAMPTLPNSITKINCNYNQINALPSLPSNIYDFDCSNNQLTSLPALPNSLLNLYCDNNSLTSLPTLPAGLATLYCSANQLVSLPALPNTINTLFCAINKLASLPTLPSSLGNFDCSNNLLTSLPTLPSNIYTFFCYSNNIQCLPILPSTINLLRFDSAKIACIPNIPKPSTLIYNAYWGNTFTPLVCNTINNPNNCTVLSNPFVNIPDSNFGKFLIAKYPSCLYKDASNKYWMDTTCSGVVNEYSMNCSYKNIYSLQGIQYFKHLGYFDCSNNQISNLLLIASSMDVLNCSNNLLTNLPTLPDLQMSYIICSNNLLTSLPTLPIKMDSLICNDNVNLSCLPKLPNGIQFFHLNVANTNVLCIPNKPKGFLNSIPTLPICNATNNSNNCFAPYVNIPDSNFGKFLIAQYPSCLYKDASNKYWMDTTCPNVLNATKFNWSTNFNIKNIEGIQYFKNLDSLSISKFTVLDSIHVLPSNLKYLKTVSCLALKIFDGLPNNLMSFNCDTNNISILPALPNSLQYLSCRFNFLHNTITSLPTALQYFDCSDNITTSLPTALPQSLQTLNCAKNAGLKCLPQLPNGLTQLNVTNTQIGCLPNMPFNLATSLVVCNTSNNNNGCPILPNTYVNIPDSNFGKFLITQYPSCLYKDASNKYWMDTTCSGVVGETYLGCNSLSISSIQGVQYFDNLLFLSCYNNQLTSLPTLPSGLNQLFSFNNPLTSYPVLPNSLALLSCSNNQLNNLPVLPGSLGYLSCGYNPIVTLPILPNNLTYLECDSNSLSTLPLLPNTLKHINCSNNSKLVSLPILPTSIQTLVCSNNKLSILPILPNSLDSLWVDGNPNLFCLPKLPEHLVLLFASNSGIACLPNKPKNNNLWLMPSTLQVCNPTNNINQCLGLPTVYGKVFTDLNSNGIKDANEFYRPFVKVSLNTGETVYTNLNGAFAISTDSVGSYTLKTTAPALFAAMPDSINFSFTQYNTSLTLADIALQPTSIKDSFVIAATGLNNRPRPGFNYTYNVGYANVGTVNATTNNIVHFNFDSSRLIFDSANVPVQSIVNGNTILVDAGALYAGQWGTFNLYFTVKTTAVIGDSLKAAAQITYSATQAYTYYVAAIVGSFDPNDKQATPELSPTQVTNGEFIEYTIRFQNTGNANATNVVIADTLSPLLQANILKILGQSHNVNIQIGNGIIYFEFLNINLPDSHTNKQLSNGFIKFQLKPVAGVTLGTVIPNTASIYFDYNTGVKTNTANTIIKTPTVPVRVKSYELRVISKGDNTTSNNQTTNAKQVLNTWMVGVETNVSHYVIQRSINGKDFSIVGKVGASNSSRYSFTDDNLPLTVNNGPLTLYYRIQIIDRDGSYIYSEVRSINLNEKQEIRSVVLYPNPAKDIVTIETVDAKALLIIDYLGKIISSKPINHQQSIINVQGFSKGLYLVKLMMNNGEIRTAKLVIE